MTDQAEKKSPAFTFTGYQKFVVGILAFLQFSIILDFMIIAPLGAIVMPALRRSAARLSGDAAGDGER